jgi:hypothetical protein
MNHLMYFITTFTCVILTLCSLTAQVRFDEEQLENSKSFGKQIEQSLNIAEIYEYVPLPEENVVYLKNGLRSSKYMNMEDWMAISDEVQATSVQIIFSKYPIKKNGYSMNHALLFKRLNNLFELDPLLNDANIRWEIILHTHCENDAQVDGLFHGVRITYRKDDEVMVNIAPPKKEEMPIILEENSTSTQNEKEHLEDLEELESFQDLPEELILELVNLDSTEKTAVIMDYYEKLLADTSSSKITAEFLKEQETVIERFIKTYGGSIKDSVTMKVLNRNPQWKNSLVVADWTGSMYAHGGQALLWHIMNFEKSGMEYFTLFNDGNDKKTRDKTIGKAGGVYFEKAKNIDKVISLYNLVMLKGGGGDGPENDLEAIIRAIKKYPNHGEIILIADNNSCVRDIELLSEIKEPVRVIICGYNEMTKLNPHYLEIALKTGGSLHTLEMDIYNLQIDIENKEKGKLKLKDFDIEIGEPPCYTKKSIYTKSYFNTKKYTNLDDAEKNKDIVGILDLSNSELNKTPKKINKLPYLRTLNMSNNVISKITPPLYNSYRIENLDLSYNKLSFLPKDLEKMYSLTRLDLSHNKINDIQLSFFHLRKLKHLDLSDNKLKELPKIFNGRYLEYLYLDNNKIEELPSIISRMKNLQELSLQNNKIKKISPKISYMKKLRILDLSNNELTELPKTMERLKYLERLIIRGNEFSDEEIKKIEKMLPNTVIEYK